MYLEQSDRSPAPPAQTMPRRAARPGAARPTASAGVVCLLDHLPDLPGAGGRVVRDALTVPTIELAGGACDLIACERDDRVTGQLFGLLVVDGLLVGEMRLAGRTSIGLYGAGDLLNLRPDEVGSLPADRLRCPRHATVALLDDRLLAATVRWPRIMAALHAVAMRQLDRARASAAISQLASVQERLLALFWQLADRWGQRRAEAVAIAFPLTHETIGQLIGARRPTVSLGLTTLEDRGLLHRDPDGTWLLDPDSLHLLMS
jgi:CRP/FNR family transcriptional regulator, cyclic AMP receptor protein